MSRSSSIHEKGKQEDSLTICLLSLFFSFFHGLNWRQTSSNYVLRNFDRVIWIDKVKVAAMHTVSIIIRMLSTVVHWIPKLICLLYWNNSTIDDCSCLSIRSIVFVYLWIIAYVMNLSMVITLMLVFHARFIVGITEVRAGCNLAFITLTCFLTLAHVTVMFFPTLRLFLPRLWGLGPSARDFKQDDNHRVKDNECWPGHEKAKERIIDELRSVLRSCIVCKSQRQRPQVQYAIQHLKVGVTTDSFGFLTLSSDCALIRVRLTLSSIASLVMRNIHAIMTEVHIIVVVIRVLVIDVPTIVDVLIPITWVRWLFTMTSVNYHAILVDSSSKRVMGILWLLLRCVLSLHRPWRLSRHLKLLIVVFIVVLLGYLLSSGRWTAVDLLRILELTLWCVLVWHLLLTV